MFACSNHQLLFALRVYTESFVSDLYSRIVQVVNLWDNLQCLLQVDNFCIIPAYIAEEINHLSYLITRMEQFMIER